MCSSHHHPPPPHKLVRRFPIFGQCRSVREWPKVHLDCDAATIRLEKVSNCDDATALGRGPSGPWTAMCTAESKVRGEEAGGKRRMHIQALLIGTGVSVVGRLDLIVFWLARTRIKLLSAQVRYGVGIWPSRTSPSEPSSHLFTGGRRRISRPGANSLEWSTARLSDLVHAPNEDITSCRTRPQRCGPSVARRSLRHQLGGLNISWVSSTSRPTRIPQEMVS